MKHSLLSYLNHISSLTNDGTDSHPAYPIFVRNAVNAVSVNILAECKKIPEKKECIAAVMYHFTLSV